MADPAPAPLSLGEPADEAAWRTLVEAGLKGAGWDKLTAHTADGVPIAPLYREPDFPAAADVSGFPGAAPFARGARAGAWTIRQAFAHPDPDEANREILADLEGGVGGIELVIDPDGAAGMAIRNGADLDRALANVILEAAAVSLDAGAHGLAAAELLRAKLKGVAAAGTAFNLDPIGAAGDIGAAARFAAQVRAELPAATALRADARPVHEAGGTEAQEIAVALASGIAYLRALDEAGLSIDDAGAATAFTMSVGADVLVEAAKLRALRLCWARVMEASGAAPEARAAHIHAFSARRMLTRYDAWSNILRITTSAFAAAIGGADDITTYPFTDALGAPTPFARRVARNTQHVLLEECRLGHVADPAGGAWFVEKLTRDLAARSWALMQEIEAAGGIAAALGSGLLREKITAARTAREAAFAARRETITGVTDFPLLDEKAPEAGAMGRRHSGGGLGLAPIRWAAPFEALRDRAEAIKPRPAVFFANLGALAEFGPRALFAQNLFAVGGIDAIGPEQAHVTTEALVAAFRRSGARAAAICGADAGYAAHGAEAARALKAAGADWIVLAGKPGALEPALREAGVDQFAFAGCNIVHALETLQTALGVLGET